MSHSVFLLQTFVCVSNFIYWLVNTLRMWTITYPLSKDNNHWAIIGKWIKEWGILFLLLQIPSKTYPPYPGWIYFIQMPIKRNYLIRNKPSLSSVEPCLANLVMVALGLSQPGVKRLKIWPWLSIKLSGSTQEKHSKEKHSVSLTRENKNYYSLSHSDKSRDFRLICLFWINYFNANYN